MKEREGGKRDGKGRERDEEREKEKEGERKRERREWNIQLNYTKKTLLI